MTKCQIPQCNKTATYYSFAPYCDEHQTMYEALSPHKNSGWNTKSTAHKPPYAPPVLRNIEDELREADDNQRKEALESKAQETRTQLCDLLKPFLTEEQLDQIVILRKDDPLVAIPASILLMLLDKHTELVEELRVIIDGLS